MALKSIFISRAVSTCKILIILYMVNICINLYTRARLTLSSYTVLAVPKTK